MKKLLLFVLTVLLLAMCKNAEAISLYAKTAGGNWSDATTWSTVDSSGTDDAGTPTTTMDAVFSSGSTGTVTVNDASSYAKSLSCEASGNKLTIPGGGVLYVYGNVKFAAGMTLGGTGMLCFLNSTSFNLTSGGLTIPWHLYLIGTATFVLKDNWAVSGLFETVSGTVTLNGFTLTLTGGLLADAVTKGSTNIVLNGGTWSSNQTTSTIMNNLTIGGTGVVISGLATYGGNSSKTLTYSGSGLDVTGSELWIMGNCMLNTSGVTWNTIRFKGAGITVLLTSNLASDTVVVDGATALNNNTGDNTGENMTVTYLLNVNAELDGPAPIILSGADLVVGYNSMITNDLTFTGSVTIPYDWCYAYGMMTNSGATVNTGGSILTILYDCTLDTAGISWYDLTVAATSNIALNSALACGLLNVNDGIAATFTGAYDISAETLEVSGITTDTSLNLTAGQMLTVSTSLYLLGAPTKVVAINSTTPSSSTNLNYSGAVANCVVAGMTFTDVDASSSAQAINNWYGGTLTRTVNITNRTTADFGGGKDIFGGVI